MALIPAKRGRNPYSTEGVLRGEDGIARYAQRPSSLVHMLQATVDRDPDATALVEVGGAALTWG
ncbi:MAG: long-chain fatty acid--CoA ligase, partial [Actinomycetota bacterium]|nr:long-chain fatty acid--CoA ligase [Actinomycetota bacterium]